MNSPGGKAYRPWTPELYAHQAHSPAAKLPEHDLVFFLLDVVPSLDPAPEAEAERRRTGTKRRGREPGPIVETPPDKAQTNFTDAELSIMQTANKGWEYCGNAQASVDSVCQIIVACDVTDQCNDQQQAEPMAEATR